MNNNLPSILGILAAGAEHDRLYQIFHKQASLMETYEELEKENGLLQTSHVPVNLDDRFGQARLKDFGWRITEEIAEVLDSQGDAKEVADVLHFLVEYTILAGYYPEDIVPYTGESGDDLLLVLYLKAADNIPVLNIGNNDQIYIYAAKLVEKLGMLNNTLKNKPWKQTYRDTDINTFEARLMETWIAFMKLVVICDMAPDYLYDSYFGKAAENINRQETGY